MKRLAELTSFAVWAVCAFRYWFPRAFAAVLSGFVLLALLLVLALSGCAAHRPPPDARATAGLVAPPGKLDSSKTGNPGFAPPVYTSTQGALLRSPTPGPLSGLGALFSTPAGTARRHAVRLARASVPRRLGKGAVYAPQATQVAAGFKNRAAVVLADSGATVTAIGKAKAPIASATGATATLTTPASSWSWWWLLIPAAWVAWRLYRATIPFA